MGKKGKRLLSTDLRKQVAANLSRLMAAYVDMQLGTPAKVAEKAGIGRNTVKRALDGASGCTLETLEAIAGAFPVEPWQLLVPGIKPSVMPLLAKPDASQKEFLHTITDLRARLEAVESAIPKKTLSKINR